MFFKKSFSTLAIGLCLVFAQTASANNFAGYFGMKFNNGSLDGGSGSVSGKSGLAAGVLGFFDMGGYGFRTGFGYAQRSYGITAENVDVTFNYGFFDVPLTVYFQAGDLIRIFAGLNLGIRSSQECKRSGGSCSIPKDAKSMITPLTVGASINFGNDFGGEFSYEMLSGVFHEDYFKDVNAINVSLAYYFE
jgi:hypothetical protein